ncbi:MAG TPA: zf-HC2 domain-containing protein [Acidobacteriota bacterium]|nr:zf-HC2 domain-containing protein [Acidobacteriota bacterium]
MNTPHLEEGLSAYLSGELDASERKLAEAHLRECRECSERLSQLRKLHDLLSTQTEIEPSQGFAKRVISRIDADQNVVRFRTKRILGWALEAAAVILFVLFLARYDRYAVKPGEIVHQTPPRVIKKVAPPSPKPAPKVIVKQAPHQIKPPLPQPIPAPQSAVAPAPEQPAQPQLSAEDAEMIANLDELENMDVIRDYDNVQNMDVALIQSEEEHIR